MRDDDLFVAVGNCVLRVRKSDGSEIWRTKLQGRFSSSLVTISVEPNGLYASAKGELFRLNPDTGDIIWKNALPKLGSGPVLIAPAGESKGS